MRDYAKRSRNVINSQSESSGTWILVCMTLSTLLFLSYLAFHFFHGKEAILLQKPIVHHEKARVISHPVIHEKKPIVLHHKVIKHPVKRKKINPADIQPKYDFYEMLPKMQVKIPNNPSKTIATTH